MNARRQISRRAFAGGALLLPFTHTSGLAQGFAGLGMSGDGFAAVVPGKALTFPADHGPRRGKGPGNGVNARRLTYLIRSRTQSPGEDSPCLASRAVAERVAVVS